MRFGMHNHRMVAGMVVAALLCGLSGCENGADMQIANERGLPVFVIAKSRFWTFGQPCFYKIDVFAEASEALAWSVSAGTQCIALTRVTYGVAPPGFKQDVPAGDLKEGEPYTVIAHGAGWEGLARFRRKGSVFVRDH